MDLNSSLETQLSGIKSLLVILNNNIEKTNDDLHKLKEDFKTMQEKIDLIDLKLINTNQKIDEDLLKECKKMGSHIDFVENVYDNVKHPLGYICKKIKYLAGGSSEQQYSLTDINSDDEGNHTNDEGNQTDDEAEYTDSENENESGLYNPVD